MKVIALEGSYSPAFLFVSLVVLVDSEGFMSEGRLVPSLYVSPVLQICL